jgi:hypothetical protein
MTRSGHRILFVLTISIFPVVADTSESSGAEPSPDPKSDTKERTDSVVKPNPGLFDTSQVTSDVIKEFEKAWGISSNGTSGKEGVVLLFKTHGAGYSARVQPKTNEQKQATFYWIPNAIAIVHTHPNRSDPRPSSEDKRLAHRFNVPMFTITIHGMYVYDPLTQKTSMIHYGLDWLDFGKWDRRRPVLDPQGLLR